MCSISTVRARTKASPPKTPFMPVPLPYQSSVLTSMTLSSPNFSERPLVTCASDEPKRGAVVSFNP